MLHNPFKPTQADAPAPAPRTTFKVAEIFRGGHDSNGDVVQQVYVKRPPRYAVYGTAERVVVQYADHDVLAAAQAATLAKLSPLRGMINGLIDGWRTHRSAKVRARAHSFDRQVADALIVALEGDQQCAEALLNEIKANVKEIRVSWARFLYLISASAAALAACGLSVAGWRFGWAPDMSDNLWLAAGAGAIGAFFSIAVGIRNRTVLPDLRWLDNAADATLRVVIGILAAFMLSLLLRAGVVTSDLLGDGAKLTSDNIDFAAVVAFTAGFFERLVPDLLEKTPLVAQPDARANSAARSAPAAVAPGVTAPIALAAAEAEAKADTDEDVCVCDHSHLEEDATPDTELPVAVGGVEPLKSVA